MFTKENFNKIIQQAQNMQSQITKMQGEMASIKETGESGAGLVKVVLNGLYHCCSLTISSDLLKEKKEVIEGLISSAFNDAVHKINEIKKKKLSFLPF